MPPRRRRGGDRASRERVGAAAAQLVGRLRRAARVGARRGSAALRAVGASASTRSSSATRATSTYRPPADRARRPVVFNPLVSLHETLVEDRGRFGPGSPAARVLRADRPDRPQARRPRRRRHGAERTPSSPSWAGSRGAAGGLLRRRGGAALPARLAAGRGLHALFVGKLIPLHGLETILAAARLAPEIPFRVVGSGQLDALLRERPPNVELDRLGRLRAAAGGEPARRVRARRLRHLREDRPRDPEQGLSGARLRDAARDGRHARRARAAADGESALLVPPGDPDGAGGSRAPARAATRSSRERSVPAASRAYRDQASEAVLGARWLGLIEQLLAR